MVGKLGIGAQEGSSEEDYNAVLSLVFAKGRRPDTSALQALAGSAHVEHGGPAFSISHMADASQGWVEVLAEGLTFDCAGLAPAEPAPKPKGGAANFRNCFGAHSTTFR